MSIARRSLLSGVASLIGFDPSGPEKALARMPLALMASNQPLPAYTQLNYWLTLLKKKLQPPGYPRALALAPPTVTVLPANAYSTLYNTYQFVQIPDPRILLSSSTDLLFAHTGVLSDSVSHNFYYTANLFAGSTEYWCMEFVTDAPRIEFLCAQTVTPPLILGFIRPRPATRL